MEFKVFDFKIFNRFGFVIEGVEVFIKIKS